MPKAGTIYRHKPDDFVEMRGKLGGCQKLAAHYGVAAATVRRWVKECGLPHIKTVPPYRGFPAPDDFAEQAKTKTRGQLKAFYGASYETVKRWEIRTGSTPVVERSTGFKAVRGCQDIPPPKRDTPLDLAVDYLRRYMPVSRCNERGAFCLDGEFYRVGSNVMNDDDVMIKAMEMAARKGHDCIFYIDMPT